ncbi:alpha/beta hydrolase [Acaricomes phytoseiuli]|uniref:alpha/beta fold hydrolase n=1 Tax=Acaricomes phytoseiuli TaxID=291968 RepID=UPI0003709C98|nr:alpha/beta hydrolase [Acaricomes phytoseiuli]MCW1249154.1 alpha/beta hydrolase [Acaricomes phytoseiuli]
MSAAVTPSHYAPRLNGRVQAMSLEPGSDSRLKTNNLKTTVRYWDYAPVRQAADAKTILAVHGFRGDHHGLERIVEQLPGHRIIMPDLPGFGSSPRLPDRRHDISGYTRVLSEFMEALDLGPDTILLGHSFGSIVTSHFVAEQPGRVSRLILINPIASPALEGPQGALSKIAESYYWAAARLPERAGRALLQSPLIVRAMSVGMAVTRNKPLRRFIHEQHDAYFSSFADRDMLLEAFTASITSHVGQVAQQLALPTLLIAGGADQIAPPAAQRRLLRRLPEGRLHVIDGVGHLIHYETPGPAAVAIEEFLRPGPERKAQGEEPV